MKSSSCAIPAVSLLAVAVLTLFSLSTSASARETVLPAGTLLKCTMNEPNFSSATVAVGDPVLCHLHSVTEFGQQTFPRGAYLVGHLESAKDPGHFWGKGDLKLMFDRIGLPNGDMPLDAKVIATRGYKVNKEGDIRGKGHATRDIVEWMIPPLWPWKIITLPARGPRPTLKGEEQITLRLMDDIMVPRATSSSSYSNRSVTSYERPPASYRQQSFQHQQELNKPPEASQQRTTSNSPASNASAVENVSQSVSATENQTGTSTAVTSPAVRTKLIALK